MMKLTNIPNLDKLHLMVFFAGQDYLFDYTVMLDRKIGCLDFSQS